jgi:hypothetical protein
MNGDEEIAARRLRRPVSQAADIAGEIDLAHPEARWRKAPASTSANIRLKANSLRPRALIAPLSLNAVTHIDRDQRRRGECYGRQRKQGKNHHVQERHAQIIAAI